MKHLKAKMIGLGLMGLVVLLSACSGGKAAVENATEQGPATVAPKPELTEEQAASKATDVKADALAVEEQNHKLRQEIYETKVKLGMEVDSGIPETTASDKAPAAQKPVEAAKAPAKSKKKGK